MIPMEMKPTALAMKLTTMAMKSPVIAMHTGQVTVMPVMLLVVLALAGLVTVITL